MEQFNQQQQGGQQAFPLTNQQEKQLIAILGVQGLSYQNYSVLELKIVLQIIKHAQKAILGYVIPYQVTSQTFNGFTAEQRAADHTDVIMKLSEFPYGAHHYPQLRDAIKRIESQPILLPFKLEKQTLYRKFACLFKSEIYQDRHKNWMVKFRFDNNVIRFFYSFDKGVSRIDLNAINQCRSASSIKLYIIMNCWGAKGFTICKTAHIQQLMHGREDYYKTWSALDNKCLTFACKDLKRLYQNHIIDQYLTYKPFFLEEGKKEKHHLPEHITFTLHDRRTSGETAEGAEVSSELRGQRSKLKLRLQCNYDVSEKKADQLSGYLRLDMIGDLEDFFLRKDYYIANCRRSNKKMNMGGYMTTAMIGFFGRQRAVISWDGLSVASPSGTSCSV